ncbi:MAG: dTDP-4-dehydrorhamnose reductase [Alphaproteobacteria bacterium]
MILVTGANGQLGNELKILLSDAIFTDVADLDICDFAAVQSFVKENNVDIIINCAAYTAVDKAEDDIELATKINVDGPENLAKSGAKIIHVSTDYVFDGLGYRPYKPEDEAQPNSVYGKTKLAGEQAVLNNANTAIIIRTAWLYSFFGNNFVKTMLRLGAEKESIGVVADQIGTPTYAGDLAQAIVEILPQIKEGQKDVYHFSNEGVASWYDFAVEILKDLQCVVNPISTEDYPTRAKRPFYSVLDKTKIKKDFNIKINHWKKGLEKCLSQF